MAEFDCTQTVGETFMVVGWLGTNESLASTYERVQKGEKKLRPVDRIQLYTKALVKSPPQPPDLSKRQTIALLFFSCPGSSIPDRGQ